MSLEDEQQRLDHYNQQRPASPEYEMLRLSAHHPSVHLAYIPAGTKPAYTVCGTLFHPPRCIGPEEGRTLCNKCRAWLDKRVPKEVTP
jgi:hypothetical protein